MSIKSDFRRTLLAGLLAGAATTAAQAGGFALVTNGDDAGPGSLRDALEIQAASYIAFDQSVTNININSTLEYSSQDPLYLWGTGQTVATTNNVTLLAITQGANLSAYSMSFQGPGSWSIANRGDQGTEPAGKGIFVDVRADQTGTVDVFLKNVSVSGVANHGIHVSDCNLPDACRSAGGSGGDGAPASVKFVCIECSIDDAGNGTFDADGLRIDDRGNGDIEAIFRKSAFTNNGADGVELDEGDNGSVLLTASNSIFSNNGGYCDSAAIDPFIPNPDTVEFTIEQNVSIDDIPTDKPGSADDACIERKVQFHDEAKTIVAKYEFANDLDDGIDLDEAGNGRIVSKMYSSEVNGNFDEGIDYDEFGIGIIDARFFNTEVSNNAEDGLKLSEEKEGGVTAVIRRSTALGNGGKGFAMREENGGPLRVNMGYVTTDNNDGDEIGVEAVQANDGTGVFKILDSSIGETGDDDGIRTEGVTEIGT